MMQVQNYDNRSAVRRYLVAVLTVAVFGTAQYLAQPLLHSNVPLGMLTVAVMISAIYGGGGPALVATALSIASGAFFLEPGMSFEVARLQDRMLLLIFSLICLSMSLMGTLLKRAHQRASGLLVSLQESELTLRALLASATQAVLAIGQDGSIRLANEAVTDIFGYRPADLHGESVELLIPAAANANAMDGDFFKKTGAVPMARGAELIGCRKDGTEFPVEVSLRMTDAPSGPLRVCFMADITKRKEAEERALHAARHDPLTDLPNRALIYELGAHLLASAHRNNGKAAVLFFDLDRFKPLNDAYGHTIGDRMLQEVAHRLKSAVRGSDLVGRLGGDEFIAILSDVHLEIDVSHAANHLLRALSAPYHIDALELRTSPSIGISLFPEDGGEIDVLIKRADEAMYHAKNKGRNNVQFFAPAISNRAEQAFATEQMLRQSVHHQDFELFYQPVIDTRTMHVVGAEALLRWRRKNMEMVLPGEFIPAAETSGLITQIGEWVLREACRQHQEWRAMGLPPLQVAINVSPIQFRSSDFQRRVGEAVLESGVNPNCIELEVTESTIMKQVDEAAITLAALKKLGLRIALDDFGTGYSSLSYLSQFPIDKLKVDQSFIRQIDSDSRSLAIAETVIALGNKLGVEVVAEGIESQEALELLRQKGCELGQGYLISHPLPPDHFVQWYRRTDPRRLFH